MTILLVMHGTALPAVDGLIAAELARQRDAEVVPLFVGGAGLGRYDCEQHVLAHGELGPNGLLWAERATGRFVPSAMQAAAIPRLEARTIVVPVNPAVEAQRRMADRVRDAATALGRPVETFGVEEGGGVFELRRQDCPETVGRWRRDRFGRAESETPRTITDDRLRARILLVGDEDLLRDTYPANIAALGDVADVLDLNVELVFLDPRDLSGPFLDGRLSEIGGIVLPGGSDMGQVEGQIEIARAAMRRDVPTLGLCLGMQTMATAAARERAGFNDANLSEADPDAQTKTFVRLRDEDDRLVFRVGLGRCRIVPGTRLGEVYEGSPEAFVHCNHRFVLDPALHGPLERAGLRIGAFQAERDVADAIEMPSLRFFVGMQGHPELLSRPDRPHPLFRAFLAETVR